MSINKVVYAYNCTVNNATGFSPFFLLYGRPPRLPIDLLFGLSPTTTTGNHTEYAKRWKGTMKKLMRRRWQTAENLQKYGRSITTRRFVVVRNLSERGGPGKLRSHWEDQIHVVVERKGEMPVFVVKPEGLATNKKRTLHRNLLLPCDFLSPDNSMDLTPAVKPQRLRNERKAQNSGEVHADQPTTTTENLAEPLATTTETCEVLDAGLQEQFDDNHGQDTDEPIKEPATRTDTAETGDPTGEAVLRRSVGTRRPPNMLNYDAMGNPTECPPYLSSVQT
ncbi:Hypothetical predicted protein, partial [Paramuricea clavata]